MKKKITNTLRAIPLLIAILFLWGCSGKDGDPGPAGEPGAPGQTGPAGRDATGLGSTDGGAIKGTLTGNLSDGTPFSQDFFFDLSEANKGGISEQSPGNRFLSFERRGDDLKSYIGMVFRYDENSLQAVDDYGDWIDFSFEVNTRQSNDKSLDIRAAPDFRPTDVRWPIESSLNDTEYHFKFKTESGSSGIYATFENSSYHFDTEGGSIVSFDESTGEFIQVRNADGSISANTLPYSDLTLKFNSHEEAYFVDEKGTDLSSIKVIPADTFTVSNYSFDKGSGALKFDFELKISGMARNPNTTEHPLTMTGNVNIYIYSDIIH